ncbi:hypothetical protein MLD38_015440 [Melastoma candidum]|uniref:Uncharacterized protein n=1 Tax=Melastoma candidum TaxID=119954 RepID=A0ACB9RG09_9MYRT|nr:hypothetical protein MLD38_015440 [Melastoma candidum]
MWRWTMSPVAFGLILIYSFPQSLDLSSRPEVSTPVTTLRRLAEGYWLKQSLMSPYSGAIQTLHIIQSGSRIKLIILSSIINPCSIKTQGQPDHMLCSCPTIQIFDKTWSEIIGKEKVRNCPGGWILKSSGTNLRTKSVTCSASA